MNKLTLFMLLLFIVKGSSAFTGESASYTMTHSNLNYGNSYNESDNYTIDYSLVEQPVDSGVSGNYTYSLGFYFGEAEKYLLKLFKDTQGAYPVLLLVMILYIAIRENGKKKIQKANMAQ